MRFGSRYTSSGGNVIAESPINWVTSAWAYTYSVLLGLSVHLPLTRRNSLRPLTIFLGKLDVT